MAARLYSGLVQGALDPEKGLNSMKVIQNIAGVLVETYLVFDAPDRALQVSLQKLADGLGCQPSSAALSAEALPPAHVIDRETEQGRTAARQFFEEWLDCAFEFHDLMLAVVQSVILSWCLKIGFHFVRDQSYCSSLLASTSFVPLVCNVTVWVFLAPVLHLVCKRNLRISYLCYHLLVIAK